MGCKTVLLTDGNETDWDMTAMRWPDLIAGDLWEIACLIVMSDGSSVEGLSADSKTMLGSRGLSRAHACSEAIRAPSIDS